MPPKRKTKSQTGNSKEIKARIPTTEGEDKLHPDSGLDAAPQDANAPVESAEITASEPSVAAAESAAEDGGGEGPAQAKDSNADSSGDDDGGGDDGEYADVDTDSAGEGDGGGDYGALAKTGHSCLKRLMDGNFIEYASYVIKERAIPDVDDGLKPVQRRILWSLFKMDDGKFHKVANVIGHTMQFHPHGDASIGDALVVLANKEYYIEKQGNFGNILTGDEASAARYIECRFTKLARETLFNNDITEFVDSYDGRNQEPVRLPVKVPSLLMLGADGIAVGMATHILPHNFNELVEAQIAVLEDRPFQVFPDFYQGGLMDVSEYDDGNGKVALRAKIERDGRRLIIREIPATTTVEGLIASIEKAESRNKIKIAAINDYTTDRVEVEIIPGRGYDPDKALKALYAYTDCSVSVSVNLMVICENRPRRMSVPEVIRRNTEKLLEYLRRELEIELGKLEDRLHEKTLERIFIENRVYKRVEKCETNEKVFSEVRAGLMVHVKEIRREITDADIDRLLAIPIRRISLFDINKNRNDIEDILARVEEVKAHLANLRGFTIAYLRELQQKYGARFPRRTIIEKFDEIDRQKVALNNIKVGWDRANCYIGTAVKGTNDMVTCNEFDHLLCVEPDGKYKVINIPDKLYIGRLCYFAKYDKTAEFALVYRHKKTGKCYYKRCVVDKFITDKEYTLCPKGCKIEILTSRPNSLYVFNLKSARKKEPITVNLADAPSRGARAQGVLVHSMPIASFRFLGLAEEKNGGDEAGKGDGGEPEDGDTIDPAAPADESNTESNGAPQATGATDGQNHTAVSAEPHQKDDGDEAADDGAAVSAEPHQEDDGEFQLAEGAPSPKKRHPKTARSEKPPKPKPPTDTDDENDDLGIVQPEFGF